MGQTAVIRGVTYTDVAGVGFPDGSSGTSTFYDVSDADIAASGSLRNGVKAAGADGKIYTGSMSEKAAATYTPSGSQQSIAADQYLAGAQTIEAVVTENLLPQYILSGVTVKVGTATDDDSVEAVTGTLQTATIYQDATTKILYIS